MIIDTLADLNSVSECCCPLDDFIVPSLEGEHFYLLQNPCYDKQVLHNGAIYYYKKYELSIEIDHTTTLGVNESYSRLDTSGKTWNSSTLTCDTDTPTSVSSGSVTCPFVTTLDVDTEIGTPPADFIERNRQERNNVPPHNYVRIQEKRYKQGYNWPDDLRTEADEVAAHKIANEDFDRSGFDCDYTWGLSALIMRVARFRYDLTAHTGSWYKITYDIAFYPEGGGPAQPYLQDQVIEWTGPAGGPPAGQEEDWHTDWVTVQAPTEKGEHRIVNVRLSGYRSIMYGDAITKTTGTSEDYV